MKLLRAQPTRDRISTASTVHDPTGLEIIIPQASQSTSNFMSSILDSYVGTDEDDWLTSSRSGESDESKEELTEEQDSGTQNIQLINSVRVLN